MAEQDNSQTDQGDQDQNQSQQQGDRGDAGHADKPVRPDNIPDAYWNDETGVDMAGLLSSHQELSEYREGIEASRAKVPEKPDAYEAKLPDDFEVPEGFELNIASDDPILADARALAHKLGASQQDFAQMMALRARMDIAARTMVQEQFAGAVKALGEKGAERVDAVVDWLKQAGLESFAPFIVSADQVRQLETFINKKTPAFDGSNREQPQEEAITDEEYEAMTPTQRIVATRKAKAAKGVHRSAA